jgi:glycosyltransferase involved in cell wall biosynthesis
MKEGSVVVASVPGGIDIIKNGRNGFLTKDKDPEDFANTCIKILTSDPLKAEIEKNAAEDIKDFDIMKTTEKYIELYKGVAGK